MNNDFYYNDNQNNNNVKYSSSQKSLLLAFAAIVLIAIGYILMTNGMFDKVNGIETTTERKIVYVGEEETIKVKSKTNGNFNPVVKFRSEKSNFTLSEDIQYGEEVETKIKGSRVGNDTLVIEAGKDNSKKEKQTKVEVVVCDKPEITNTGDKTLNIKENNSVKLNFNVTEECLKGYEIEIENKNVASLDNDHNLTAKKVGTTNLVLKRNNDRIKYKINVKSTNVAVKSVKVNTKSFNLAIGKTKKLSISVLPGEAVNRKATYTSSDESIATVSSNGTVKGVSVGTVTITVTSVSDSSKSGSVKVKVYKQVAKTTTTVQKPTTTTTTTTPATTPNTTPIPTPKPTTVSVTGIKFDKSSYTIAYNETKKLTLGITPTNATNKSITCKSQNTTIVTASASGNVCTIKGMKPGTTTIEAYSVDGNKKATASITVSPIAVKSIAFEKTSYSVNIGATETAVVKFTPTNASNQTLTCTSSDNSIATVSAKGASCVVKGVKAGSVTITATSQDGSKTAKTALKVNTVLVTGVSFATTSYNIDEGKTITLTPTISPSTATNKGYTCSSSNTGVATITSGCTVKGVSAGTAIITVTTSDGGKTSTATVTVKKTVNKVTVTFATFNVGYFACGSYSGASCRPTTTDMVNLIKKYGIDVVGMQEARDTSKNTDPNASCPYTTYKVNSIKNGLGYNGRIVCPANVDAILSKYKFESNKVISLRQGRDLTKVVLKINGVDISFYNTHLSYKDAENIEHFKKVADAVRDDPNPIIMTGDWNYTQLDRFKTYLLNPDDMKFTIAAYDTTTHNMWGRTSYCDAILVKSKGHIDIVSSQTVDTYNSYSDHNMVIAKLNIY